MKRIIALLLVFAFSLGLTACSQVSANDLMKNVPAKAVDVLPDMDAGAAAAADFGVRLFQTSMEEGKNTLISPLSVLYALAMTTNGADGETLAQMEQVLGMDVDNLNSYMLAYLDLLPESKDYKLSLANSIWFKDDPDFISNSVSCRPMRIIMVPELTRQLLTRVPAMTSTTGSKSIQTV